MTDYDINDDDRWEQVHRERVRMQTQLDRLAERVERQGELIEQLESYRPGMEWACAQCLTAPTPPPATAPDEATKWEDPRPWRAVADAYDEAYAALDDPMNFHDNDSRVAGVRAAVAKAVALGLAAPADRVVCEVTDDIVDLAMSEFVLGEAGRWRMRKTIEAVAAYWSAGADDAQ